MIKVTKQYRTETGHRLTNYDGKCAHLHGHSYLWELTVVHVSGQNPDNGMAVDFKDVKKMMVSMLEPLDHAMVLGPDDPLWSITCTAKGSLSDMLLATNNDAPRLIKWQDNPTAESFARWAVQQFREYSANNDLPIVIDSVRVWETATSFAEAINPHSNLWR